MYVKDVSSLTLVGKRTLVNFALNVAIFGIVDLVVLAPNHVGPAERVDGDA